MSVLSGSASLDIWGRVARPEKALARSIIFDGVGYARSTLFLPARNCLCVQEALRYGVINRHSTVIAVERDPMIARAMRRKLRTLGFNATIHQGSLHSLTIARPLDFAFIDLNGVLDRRIAMWCHNHLARRLNASAALAFSLAHAWRNNKFMPYAHSVLWARHRTFVLAISDELACTNMDVVLTVALFRVLFAGWRFHTEFRLKYRDVGSVPMTAYRFYDFYPDAASKLGEVASLLFSLPSQET